MASKYIYSTTDDQDATLAAQLAITQANGLPDYTIERLIQDSVDVTVNAFAANLAIQKTANVIDAYAKADDTIKAQVESALSMDAAVTVKFALGD